MAISAVMMAKVAPVLGIGLLAVGVYTGYLYLRLDASQEEAKRLENQYTEVLATNQLQANTIKEMANQRKVDEALVAAVRRTEETSRRLSGEMLGRMGKLEESNEAVNDYLNTRIPDHVVRLLVERTSPGKGGDGETDASGDGDGPVP